MPMQVHTSSILRRIVTFSSWRGCGHDFSPLWNRRVDLHWEFRRCRRRQIQIQIQMPIDAEKKKGMIGKIVQVYSDFNFNASDSEEYPASFVYNHNLGGGASFLVVPYPIAAVTLFFPQNDPDEIKAVGQMDVATGVDLQATMLLNFPPMGSVSPALNANDKEESTPKLPGAGAAIVSCGLLGESEEETVVLGTKGRMKICTPGHCPSKIVVNVKGEGRGNSEGGKVYEYPVPDETEEIRAAGGYFYPNSAGLSYEAAAVTRCIAAGKIEAPQYKWSETLTNMRVIDEIRSQLNVEPL